MKYIVDRIEGRYAVCICEDGKRIKILISLLPHNVKVGDVLKHDRGEYILPYKNDN